MTHKESTFADQKRARALARANWELEQAKLLAEMGITPPEAALFNVIHYSVKHSPSILAGSATCPDYSLAGPVTEEDCQAALADCLAKGTLQVIDERALAKIVAELREGQLVGPVYGLPVVGCVDFTETGAELWQQLCRRFYCREWPPSDFTDVVHRKTSQYFRTKAAAFAAMNEMNPKESVTVTGPTPIGPWRVQWWRRFPEGYRLDIEERNEWQGYCSVGDHCFMHRTRQKSDPQRLRHVLDCHNVTPAEWLLLAAMEHQWQGHPSLPRCVAKSAGKKFGLTASEEECRDGLEACLRYGWLRIVDQHAVDEVHALLRDDPVFLPVPSEVKRNWATFDFTSSGASLYRMIAAEWLGPDWEDALSVWKEHYREEHRYCEAEEGFQGIIQEYADKGVDVRASQLVPLGPWCVDWWERFPSGYRLELKIGEF